MCTSYVNEAELRVEMLKGEQQDLRIEGVEHRADGGKYVILSFINKSDSTGSWCMNLVVVKISTNKYI